MTRCAFCGLSRMGTAPAARAWLEQAVDAGLGDLDSAAVIAAARSRP